MRERVIYRFTRNGGPLRLERISPEGVMFDTETDAWPRRLTLEFDAESPITRLRMDQVRQNKGWGSKVYKLKLSAQDGTLVVTGVDSAALPHGRYWFRLRIEDLILPAQRISVELKENQDTLIDVEVCPDPQQVEQSLDSTDPDQPKGFFIHMGEALSPDKTDHLKLSGNSLTDQTVREFLY
jgi:hypothetical protein